MTRPLPTLPKPFRTTTTAAREIPITTLDFDVSTDHRVYFTDWTSIPQEYDVFFKVKPGVSFKGVVQYARGLYTLISFDGEKLQQAQSLQALAHWIKTYSESSTDND